MIITFDMKNPIAKTVNRCSWCLSDPLYIHYHDHEWGKPIYDDQRLFAQLCLESMQSGLSWITILKKRDNYYHAFDEFDAIKITQYDQAKIEALMQNTGIIRHLGKINAIINNAKAYLAITEHQSFSDYLWGIATPDGKPVINYPKTLADIPTQNEVSARLAKALKQQGFKFIGSTTCYAFMQAVGMVNDHLIDCDFRKKALVSS
ncbi:DNA-3-methyladenine glycosylase I [Moraxella catarrhalis]|uniref:DNA-3-methyladenine glycosylase I n=1 Tax=Moraxella catarrhalis TaxID=480 RepID=UPI0002029E8E|nr:DNA-3-methyladenine glycosylase I [Moraxella catarrhalis]AXT93507.1 3-methyladenine DNA glycosylase [Moraxella catarrhalis]EGE19684.1 DNA-3-methyladenine glycosylase 1 [Moraxella catarrhalis BC1]MPW49844.1 DNA-3-methyladenine glycosylase I [Moraxella catarrhalis]